MIEELYEDAARCYHNYDYTSALEKINDVLILDKTNNRARNLKASILIESWDGSDKTRPQIMEALSHLKELIKYDPENSWGYQGNIGNAFSNIANAEKGKTEIG